MQITAISSLNLLARDSALNAGYLGLKKRLESTGSSETCQAMSLINIDPPADAPSGPDPDFPEAGDNPPRVYFRLSIHSQDGEMQETLCVLSDCISCATNALLPELLEKVTAEHLVLALPAGVSLGGIIDLLAEQDPEDFALESAQYATLVDELEADLWVDRSLAELGVTGSCLDERKPGEFLVKELALADVLVTSEMPFDRVTYPGHRRTYELLEHLAPHLSISSAEAHDDHSTICGCHVLEEAQLRSEPGYLANIAPKIGENFTTVVLKTDQLLDAQKLGVALRKIVRHACRVRGYFWMSGYELEKVAIEGVGPQTWLQSRGAWDEKTPSTAIAVTGQDLDRQKLQEILDSCILSGDRFVEDLLKSAG